MGSKMKAATVSGPQREDLSFELVREVGRQMRGCAATRRPVSVGGGHEGHLQEAPLERASPGRETGNRQGTQGVPVPGALAGDEAPLLHLAASGKVLQGNLERGLDGFGAIVAVEDIPVAIAGNPLDELGQGFEC